MATYNLGAPNSGTSRYSTGSGGAATTDARVTTTGSQSVGGSTSQTQTQNTTGSQTTQNNQTSQTLDNGSIAALEQLIRSLQAANVGDQKARADQISLLGSGEQQYSKAAAFNDAQGLIQQAMRRSLEAALPGIRAATESAGSSGGALQALLMQDAAQRASESSSALGAQVATQYGGVAANFAKVLQDLISSPTGSSQALINAMQTLKGAVTNTTGNQTTNTTQNTTGTTVGSTQQTTNSTENKNIDYAPFQITTNSGPAPQSSTAPIYYGPVANSDPVGFSPDLLAAMSTTRAFDTLFTN